MIRKVVLTGGPCAGKSTALSKLESEFLERGFAVLVVPESATELIQGGVRPFGNQAIYGVDFQKIILDYQLNKEKSYNQAAKFLEATGRDVIILHDRGVMDNKAYLDLTDWNHMLHEKSLFETDLVERYDLVIHMVTAALGKEAAYTLANNGARTETKEEAIELDGRTLSVWSLHSNLKVIDNSCEFEEKVENVLNECLALIGERTSIREQRKFVVDPNVINLDLWKDCRSKSVIEQFYLDYPNNSYEYRIRDREIDGNHYYSMTVQEKLEDGRSILVQKRKLSQKEYLHFLKNGPISGSIKKTRYTCLQGKEQIRLDLFESGLTLLEVEPISKNHKIEIPNGIIVLEDVSRNKNYQNKSLAKTMGKIAI